MHLLSHLKKFQLEIHYFKHTAVFAKTLLKLQNLFIENKEFLCIISISAATNKRLKILGQLKLSQLWLEESSPRGITRVGGAVPTHITVYMNSLYSRGENLEAHV